MGAKTLKPAPMLIPEGLYTLPTPLMLFQKDLNLLWANPAFEKTYGVASIERFRSPSSLPSSLHLIRERPVSTDIFCLVGRHEGFVLQDLNQKNNWRTMLNT